MKEQLQRIPLVPSRYSRVAIYCHVSTSSKEHSFKVYQIITKSISRFGRNTKDTLEAINNLRELGVDVFFENEEFHTEDSNSILVTT